MLWQVNDCQNSILAASCASKWPKKKSHLLFSLSISTRLCFLFVYLFISLCIFFCFSYSASFVCWFSVFAHDTVYAPIAQSRIINLRTANGRVIWLFSIDLTGKRCRARTPNGNAHVWCLRTAWRFDPGRVGPFIVARGWSSASLITDQILIRICNWAAYISFTSRWSDIDDKIGFCFSAAHKYIIKYASDLFASLPVENPTMFVELVKTKVRCSNARPR